MDKSDIPDLTRAPGSLLEALESHMLGLDNKKPQSMTNSLPTATTNVISSSK
jgi:hypothetical protein